MRNAGAALAALFVGCTPTSAPSQPGPSSGLDAAFAPPSASPASASDGGSPRDHAEDRNDAAASVADDTPARPTFRAIEEILFADRASPASAAAACPVSLGDDARVRCLYVERYKGDAKAAGLAEDLLDKFGIVAGVEVAHTMDGGYRGMIRLEPAVPVGAERKHLEWVVSAFVDFGRFFDELLDVDDPAPPGVARRRRVSDVDDPAPPGVARRRRVSDVDDPAPPGVARRRRVSDVDGGAGAALKTYRFRGLTVRFARSVSGNRPSAYANDWTIAYNVAGSINLSADMVRETFFHEIFHLNDAAPAHRGSAERWSPGALGALYDPIVKKCGTSIPCLTPYTPNETIVRGGTYYSFQPGNGDAVVEYAAELALRYYREQRISLRGLPKIKMFKCGPPENARAWAAMKDEFFAGIDVTPPCP